MKLTSEQIVMPTISRETLTYPVVETFHSVQGEGYWTGVSAFFIRLAGCDVCCPWCDQKESWNPKRHPQKSLAELVRLVLAAHPAIVVVTGGEPLMHDLTPLTEQLQRSGLKDSQDFRINNSGDRQSLNPLNQRNLVNPDRMRVHLETSGSYPFSGHFDWVTFSPKPFKLPHDSIYDQVDELKVVIAGADDLYWAEEQGAKVPASAVKYLQPEWNTPQSQVLVWEYILQHPEWRLSLQTHKFLGVR